MLPGEAPLPCFIRADAAKGAFWTAYRNRFTHVYAFDPAFPGKDWHPEDRERPEGEDVLLGIARGLNSCDSWQVFMSFQPPHVWSFKGLKHARLVERIQSMHMRVSHESKTAYVYLRDPSVPFVDDGVSDYTS